MDSGQTFSILPSDMTHQTSTPSHDAYVGRVLQPRSSNSQSGFYLPSDYGSFKADKPTGGEVYSGVSSRHGRHSQYSRQRRHALDSTGEWTALLKYAMQNEHFRKYRENQMQKDKPQKPAAMKWPLHLEEAFFRALVVWQPMGREKKQVDGQHKRMGRNELIAKFITDDTGIVIDRKRVSSHIQVIGNFFKGDKIFMEYLRQPANNRVSSGRLSSHRSHASITGQRMMNRVGSGTDLYGSGSGQGSYPKPHRQITGVVPPQHPSIFNTHEFQMYIADSNDKKGWIFTKFSRNVRAPTLKLENTPNWQENLPLLSEAIQEAGSSMDALYAQSTIALTGEALRPEKDRLSIASVFSSEQDLARVFDLECRTSFYEHGVLKTDFQYKDPIEQEATPNGQKLYILRFGSRFWARKFVDLSSRLRHNSKVQEPGTEEERSLAKARQDAIEEDVRKQIRGIDAVQEILGYPKGESSDTCSKPQRLMMINWKFRQAREGEAAQTTFRKIIPPPECRDAAAGSSEFDRQSFNTDFPYVFPVEDIGEDMFRVENFDHNTAVRLHPDLDTLSSAATLEQSSYPFEDFSMSALGLQTDSGFQEIHTTNIEQADFGWCSADQQFSMPEFAQSIGASLTPTFVPSQPHATPRASNDHGHYFDGNLQRRGYQSQPAQYFQLQPPPATATVYSQYTTQAPPPAGLQVRTYSNYHTTSGQDYLSPHSATQQPSSACSQSSSFDESYSSRFGYSQGQSLSQSQPSVYSPTHQLPSSSLPSQPSFSQTSRPPHSRSHVTTPQYVFTPQKEHHSRTPTPYNSHPPSRLNSFARGSITPGNDMSMYDEDSQRTSRHLLHPPMQLGYDGAEASNTAFYDAMVSAGASK